MTNFEPSENSLLPSVVSHCFALRKNYSELTLQKTLSRGTLPALHSQDLANALPFLACGEESAIHAFSGSLLKHLDANQCAAMAQIANDELRHAQWLEQLRLALPNPNQILANDELSRFFKRMLTRNSALHFARVAALDSAVCKLLTPLLHVKSALFVHAPEIHAGLIAIVRDEARHVKAARAMAKQFGINQATRLEVNASIQSELWQLLSPVLPGLARLASHETISA